MTTPGLPVRWVRRNRPVGALPFIIQEDDLPRGQRILVFLPHSDDGRFIGATLSLLNRAEGGQPRNQVRIVVVCPGYRSVEGDMTNEEKGQLRRGEALCWARELGFSPEQVLFFGADRTYARRRIEAGEQERMDRLVREERPTVVLLTHVSDIAQHANHCTRSMALNAVTRWMTEEHRSGRGEREVLVVEYPTLFVPILPPSDKNVIVAFSDPAIAQTKYRADLCHRSQERKYLEMLGRLVEAIDVLSGADAVCEARRAGTRFARQLSTVALNPVKSKGEHFGVTRLRIGKARGGAGIVEERLKFPLSSLDGKSWSPSA
jgi:LmbE family N-acetylglucosaminyl deacetylase